MSEQHKQRLLCPGCGHRVVESQPEPDAFRYLTIDEMKAASYKCHNISCQIYIEEERFFAEDTYAVSRRTVQFLAPCTLTPHALSLQEADHTAAPSTPRRDTTPASCVSIATKDSVCEETSDDQMSPAYTAHVLSPTVPRTPTPARPRYKTRDNLATHDGGPGRHVSEAVYFFVASPQSGPSTATRKRNKWSRDEVNILMTMRAQGQSWVEIAKVSSCGASLPPSPRPQPNRKREEKEIWVNTSELTLKEQFLPRHPIGSVRTKWIQVWESHGVASPRPFGAFGNPGRYGERAA